MDAVVEKEHSVTINTVKKIKPILYRRRVAVGILFERLDFANIMEMEKITHAPSLSKTVKMLMVKMMLSALHVDVKDTFLITVQTPTSYFDFGQ